MYREYRNAVSTTNITPSILNMAEIDVNTGMLSSDVEDDRPLAVRRKRRSSIGINMPKETRTNHYTVPRGMNTPPATPQRSKKRVRFSDPGPAIPSTGLTPFVRRTSLGTPSSSSRSGSRRHSTPAKLWNLSVDDTPITGTLQFAPLRQVLEGRVKRRIRRNRLSEEFNNIESDKREEHKARKAETELLKEKLRQKDIEIAFLRDEQDLASQLGDEAGVLVQSPSGGQVQELETQIAELQAQLRNREDDDPNWTMAARDPFNDDDTCIMPSYDDEFDEEMTDIMMSTPARRSFPSPPTTGPNTPSKLPIMMNESIPGSIPDLEKENLQVQLRTLEAELQALTASIERANTTQERLEAKLQPYLGITISSTQDESLDLALDTVLTQLALSQSSALENSCRFSALAADISELGFSSDPETTLQTLHNQFRRARIDLENLNPGEYTEGFENNKLLSMLVSRLRVVTEKVKEQDSNIDEYHEQEISLRQQLGARVDALDSMHAAVSGAQAEIISLNEDVKERDESVKKLARALEGYRTEVRGLEGLITRMETDHASASAALQFEIDTVRKEGESNVLDEVLKGDLTKAELEGQEMLVAELEKRLHDAVETINALKVELTSQSSIITTLQASTIQREKEHGDALALRDARVLELREEITRVNISLKEAHASILSLRSDNRALCEEKKAIGDELEREKDRGRRVIDAVREQLESVVRTAAANGYVTVEEPQVHGDASGLRSKLVTPTAGGFLNGLLARRRSSGESSRTCGAVGEVEKGKGKKSRRYDSGLGFLEEEDVLV